MIDYVVAICAVAVCAVATYIIERSGYRRGRREGYIKGYEVGKIEKEGYERYRCSK